MSSEKTHSFLRIKLTALYLLIFGSTLILFSVLLYRGFTRAQQDEFDVALYNHAVDIAHGVQFDIFGRLTVNPDVLSTEGKILSFSEKNILVRIINLDGTEIARSRSLGRGTLPLGPKEWKLIFTNRGVFQTLSSNEIGLRKSDSPLSYRLLTAVSPGQASRDFVVQLAVPEIFINPIQKDLQILFWFGIPLTLILATLAGLYLSNKALQPTDDLLERLQKAVQSQERFVADASHELKTPLAILRGELDVFKSRSRSPQEVTEWIHSAWQELGNLSKLVEDLLILARIDAGRETLAKRPTRLDEMMIDVISLLEKVATPKRINLRLNLIEDSAKPSPLAFELVADPDLLKIMAKNLVENAIHYSSEGQSVEIKIRDRLKDLELQVIDEGCGIPAEFIPKIFERFYRVKQSNRKDLPGAPGGTGLGLSIAKTITETHGGKIQVHSTPERGTTFTVTLPKNELSDSQNIGKNSGP